MACSASCLGLYDELKQTTWKEESNTQLLIIKSQHIPSLGESTGNDFTLRFFLPVSVGQPLEVVFVRCRIYQLLGLSLRRLIFLRGVQSLTYFVVRLKRTNSNPVGPFEVVEVGGTKR